MIPQDALRVTQCLSEPRKKKKNLRNMSRFMQKTLETTHLDPGTENRLSLSLEVYLVTGDEKMYLKFMQVRGKRKVSPNLSIKGPQTADQTLANGQKG